MRYDANTEFDTLVIFSQQGVGHSKKASASILAFV